MDLILVSILQVVKAEYPAMAMCGNMTPPPLPSFNKRQFTIQ